MAVAFKRAGNSRLGCGGDRERIRCSGKGCGIRRPRIPVPLFVGAVLSGFAGLSGDVRGEAFLGYQPIGALDLPAGAAMFDALPDGRVITLSGNTLYVESAAGGGQFAPAGVLPGADFPSFGAAFLRVSPDGARLAVGNNGGSSFGNFRVGVFHLATLAGQWFAAAHYDGAWADNSRIALTAGDFGSPAYVTVLDTDSLDPESPDNPTVISGIGGASAGVAFDAAGNLFTGNGFVGGGPSGTGAIKAFSASDWEAAYAGGNPLNFETQGILVVDVLSASPLEFDGEGNLLVGGGDFSKAGESNFVALVRASAITTALMGQGAVPTGDPQQVRKLDPDPANDFNYFFTASNQALSRIYAKDVSESVVHIYLDTTDVPTASTWGLVQLGLLMAISGSLILRPGRSRIIAARTALVGVLVGTGEVVPVARGERAPFSAQVLEYAPAPGQFINNPQFNEPIRALGAPIGGGTSEGNNQSIVSLGGFGGYIVLGFEQTVMDDPLNPMGLDAIVFGNAYWVGGDAERHWAECATIEISLDVNGNALADDPWYLIPGSHTAPGPVALLSLTWDDDLANPAFPPLSPPATSAWLPQGKAGQWFTQAYALPEQPFHNLVILNPTAGTGWEGIFGYAEYSPTLLLGDLDADDVVDDPEARPEDFYAVPDDPFETGITPGSGGGDAFDIAWAIDPATGKPARLSGFDFIRLTTPVHSVSQPIGEKSAEIDAVSDVAADPFGDADEDGDIDLVDAAWLSLCFGDEPQPETPCARLDRQGDVFVDVLDATPFLERFTGPRS